MEGILLCRSATAHKKTHELLEAIDAERAKEKTDEQLRSDKKQLYMKVTHFFPFSRHGGWNPELSARTPTLDNVPLAAFVISVGISSTS